MKYLSEEQAIEQLEFLLHEDIKETFKKQLTIAGEHGEPSFFVRNSVGIEIEVGVEWDKEADQLTYVIYH